MRFPGPMADSCLSWTANTVEKVMKLKLFYGIANGGLMGQWGHYNVNVFLPRGSISVELKESVSQSKR